MNYICPSCSHYWRQCSCQKGPFLDIPTPSFNVRKSAPKPVEMPRRVECPRCEGDGQVSVNTLDELTVNDVLGFVSGAVENADDYHPLGARIGGDDITRLWQLRSERGLFSLTNMMSREELLAPTLRDLMVLAKRRGLLG